MRQLLFCIAGIFITISSFGQFADTIELNAYIRDTIRDRRPEKVTAAQLQKALLGTANFLTPNPGNVSGTGTANRLAYWTGGSAIDDLSAGTLGQVLTSGGASGPPSWQAPVLPAIGGAITGGTTGSVLFAGSGSTIAQDNTNFFWDATLKELSLTSDASGIPLRTIRSTNLTNEQRSSLVSKHVTSSSMVDGFGTEIGFVLRDNSNVDNTVGRVGAKRDGGDNTGLTYLSVTNAGTERIALNIRGNASTFFTGHANTVPIFNFNSSASNNSVIIYGDGQVGLGSGAIPGTISSVALTTGIKSSSGASLGLFAPLTTNPGIVGYINSTGAFSPTSGESGYLVLGNQSSFAPSSGNASFVGVGIRPVYNTTGTYSGTGIALDINPTLTSTTGLNHIALRSTSGAFLIGLSSISSATTLTVKANGSFGTQVAEFQSTSGNKVMSINNDYSTNFGSSFSIEPANFGTIASNGSGVNFNATGSNGSAWFKFRGGVSSGNSAVVDFSVQTTNFLAGNTSDIGNFIRVRPTIENTSGSNNNAQYRILSLVPAYNYTGGSGHTLYGVYYNPTLTSTTGIGAHYAAVFNTGSVGIGTTTPSALFEVRNSGNGEIARFRFETASSTGSLQLYQSANQIGELNIGGVSASGAAANRVLLTATQSGGTIAFRAGNSGTDHISISSSGLVTLGATPTNDDTETSILVRQSNGEIQTRSAASLVSGIGGSFSTNQIVYGSGSNTAAGNSNFLYNSPTNGISVNTVLPSSGNLNLSAPGSTSLGAGTDLQIIAGGDVLINPDEEITIAAATNHNITITGSSGTSQVNIDGVTASIGESSGASGIIFSSGAPAFYSGTTQRLQIESDGSWNIGGSNGTTGQPIVSNGSSSAPSWGPVLSSGTYTPTITNGTNVDSSTPAVTHYQRIGNIVHVSGEVSINFTTATNNSSVRISLPPGLSSDFTGGTEVTGIVSVDASSAYHTGFISVDPVNDAALLLCIAPSISTHSCKFQFTYIIN